MHKAGSSFIAGHLWKILSERTPLEKMISKGIHQSATPILISRMNDHAGRLIYNQYMFIFKNNIERNIFGLNISIARRFRKRDGDHIIRMDLVIGLNAFFIDFNKSLMNAILDFCTRDIRQSIHKKLVDAHQTLPGIRNNAMVLKEIIVWFVNWKFLISHFFGK